MGQISQEGLKRRQTIKIYLVVEEEEEELQYSLDDTTAHDVTDAATHMKEVHTPSNDPTAKRMKRVRVKQTASVRGIQGRAGRRGHFRDSARRRCKPNTMGRGSAVKHDIISSHHHGADDYAITRRPKQESH